MFFHGLHGLLECRVRDHVDKLWRLRLAAAPRNRSQPREFAHILQRNYADCRRACGRQRMHRPGSGRLAGMRGHSIECSSSDTIKVANDQTGVERKSHGVITKIRDDSVQERIADIVGNLIYFSCCDEFMDGQSSTTNAGIILCCSGNIERWIHVRPSPELYTQTLALLRRPAGF